MMFYYEDLSCPVCGKAFTADDDIVVCPECGLPHHRACWRIDNRCHAHADHGTERQWSRESAAKETGRKATTPIEEPKNSQVCPRCFTKNAEFAEICSHCGQILHPANWSAVEENDRPREENYTPYRAPYDSRENRYSPVDRIGEYSAAEMAAVVGMNSDYYLPRFRLAASGEGGGWHWAGFLLGPLWLLYRKQYLLGTFMFIMQTLLSILTSILYLPMNSAQTSQELMEATVQVAAHPMFFPVWVLSSVLFVGRLLLGLRGSNLYYYHCTRRIRAAKAKYSDISSSELATFGGTSIGLILVLFVISMLVNSMVSALLLQ